MIDYILRPARWQREAVMDGLTILVSLISYLLKIRKQQGRVKCKCGVHRLTLDGKTSHCINIECRAGAQMVFAANKARRQTIIFKEVWP